MGLSVADFRKWFWSDSFWLPPNVTWQYIERRDDYFIPDITDMWITLPMAVVVFCLRLVWERYVALPFGRRYKLREAPLSKPPPNDILEKAFKLHGKIRPVHKQIVGYAKQLDWSPRQVERWWQKRTALGLPSQMQKFQETSWRFIFYLFAFWYGLYSLWDKPWIWETAKCWDNYPRQHVPSEIWWYYMIELSFYLSLVLSQFRDVKRKDFKEMTIHHIATISLFVLSWTNNMVRIGTLVVVTHDTVDYWMEGAKLAKYCKMNKLCNVMFVIFTLLWFITRIVFYPVRILYCTLFQGHLVVGMFPMYYIYNGLLCTLQVLHAVWFYMILRMLGRYVIHGKIEKDDRSDTEPESDSDVDNVPDADGNHLEGDQTLAASSPSGHLTTTLANNIKAHGDGIDLRKNCVGR